MLVAEDFYMSLPAHDDDPPLRTNIDEDDYDNDSDGDDNLY